MNLHKFNQIVYDGNLRDFAVKHMSDRIFKQFSDLLIKLQKFNIDLILPFSPDTVDKDFLVINKCELICSDWDTEYWVCPNEKVKVLILCRYQPVIRKEILQRVRKKQYKNSKIAKTQPWYQNYTKSYKSNKLKKYIND